MPTTTGNPLEGEVWEMTDPSGRVIRGVIADVSTSILTLISFTGNRFRIAPDRLHSSWRFFQSPPNTGLRCTRRGCSRAGILRYTRGQVEVDWVCPRHLPVGVHATLTTESLGARQPEHTPQIVTVSSEPSIAANICPACAFADPVEELRCQLPAYASLWICTRCPSRWCLISPPTHDQPTADEIRVALSIANYTIREIVATRAIQAGGTLTSLYAGIPVRWDPAFEPTSPSCIRLTLAGGPEHRTSPEPFVTMGRGHPPTPQEGVMVSSSRPTTAEASPAESEGLLNSMTPSPFINKGSRWVNRSTGELVEVDRLGRSTEGDEPVVHFKRVSDSHEVNSVLLLRDFEVIHRSYTQEFTRTSEAVAEVLKDEEWEHVETGEVVVIDSVDTKRNLVIVVAKEKRRSVLMLDFVNCKWRKIVRRTAYARLLEDD